MDTCIKKRAKAQLLLCKDNKSSRKKPYLCRKYYAMKKTVLAIGVVAMLMACHEGIEERAAREAREYTERFCPTPVQNFTRTDSVVFYKDTKTYTYYCSVVDRMDDEAIIKANQANLQSGLLASIKQNTNIVVYKKANFNFAYVLHSSAQPQKVLFKATYSPKDYNQ